MRIRGSQIISAVVLAFGPWVFASEPCLHYEPEVVELVGIMNARVFPGPPNFESVKNGDTPERYWVLKLARPICVVPDRPDRDGIDEPESGIKLLQLNQPNYTRYRYLLGKRVKVKGRLTHAITGHHHTKVMLEIITIDPAT